MSTTQQALLYNLVKIFSGEIKNKIRKKFAICRNGRLGTRSKWIVLKNFSSALFRALWPDQDYLKAFPNYSSTMAQVHEFLLPLFNTNNINSVLDEHLPADCPISDHCRHREEIRIALPCRVHFSPEREQLRLYFFVEIVSYSGHVRK